MKARGWVEVGRGSGAMGTSVTMSTIKINSSVTSESCIVSLVNYLSNNFLKQQKALECFFSVFDINL